MQDTKLMPPLGYVYRGRVENTIGFGLPDTNPDFWITQSIPGVPPGPAHVAFPAVTREVVHRFFLAAIKAGAKCQGEPALRDIRSGYYSAAVIDFDNNSIEAVYREDVMGPKVDTSSNVKSVVSMSQKSSTKSKAATTVSSASKAKTTTPSEITSASHQTKSKIATSRASTNSSSVASSAKPRTVVANTPSKASNEDHSSSNGISEFLDEAKGTLNVARELVSSVTGNKNKPISEADSHASSDAIVGTLLGVAAGAALHYAFSNRKKNDSNTSYQEEPHPGITRSETAPSYSQERYRYYHGYETPQPQLAIENGRSASSRVLGQRMIEMIDNDPALSEYAPSTIRPQRRNSFTGPFPSHVSSARSRKLLDAPAAPPTSYRAPTQISAKSSRSRSSSLSRGTSKTIQPSSSPKQDEGYASASETRSHASRRSSTKNTTSSSHDSSVSRRRRRGSESQSQTSSVITAIKNKSEPLPSRKVASNTFSDLDKQSFHSTRTSKSIRRDTSSTDINPGSPIKLTRKQLEKLEDNGRPRSDITRSVIGKVKDVDRLDLSAKEVRPEDSVSQVSSNTSRRRK